MFAANCWLVCVFKLNVIYGNQMALMESLSLGILIWSLNRNDSYFIFLCQSAKRQTIKTTTSKEYKITTTQKSSIHSFNYRSNCLQFRKKDKDSCEL